MWATTLFHHPAPALQWGAVLGAALIGACTDARARRIPNLLTGPVFVLGLGCSAAVGGWAGLGDALLASALLAAPFALLFACAAGGAGDAKLMAALGAWLGVVWGVVGLVAVCLCGVLLGVLQASLAGRLEAVLSNVSSAACSFLAPVFGRPAGAGLDAPGRFAELRAALPPTEGALTMPYGLAILAGMLVAAGGALLWSA